MSAPLPGTVYLPASREFALIKRTLDELPTATRLRAVMIAEAASSALREGLRELDTLSLNETAVADWSRRTFAPLLAALPDFLELFALDGVIGLVAAELEKQRDELANWLRPARLDTQADWALITLQLFIDVFNKLHRTAPMPSVSELEQAARTIDLQGPVGAGIRMIFILTYLLELARAGTPPTEHHAALVARAYVDANQLISGLRRDLGVNLDPMPYMRVTPEQIAKTAVLRLLELPPSHEDAGISRALGL